MQHAGSRPEPWRCPRHMQAPGGHPQASAVTLGAVHRTLGASNAAMVRIARKLSAVRMSLVGNARIRIVSDSLGLMGVFPLDVRVFPALKLLVPKAMRAFAGARSASTCGGETPPRQRARRLPHLYAGGLLLFATSKFVCRFARNDFGHVRQQDRRKRRAAERADADRPADIRLKVINLWHFDTPHQALRNPRPLKLASPLIQLIYLQ